MRFRRTLTSLVCFALLTACSPGGGTLRAGAAPKAPLTRVEKAVNIRSDMWARMGAERAARGLPPLVWNGRLSEYGQRWAKRMGTGKGLTHSNIGSLLGPYNYIGENIGDASPGSTAATMHSAFMKSAGHRDDIMSPGFTSAGIGVWCAPSGAMWVTVDFARKTSQGQQPAYGGGTSLEPFVRDDPSSAKC